MFSFRCVLVLLLNILVFRVASCEILEGFFNKASECKKYCDGKFSESVMDLRKSCNEGCRLYIMIKLAKDLKDCNKTVQMCQSACQEAFLNESAADACNQGCSAYPPSEESAKAEPQTLHVLTPIVYVSSAYSTMIHHVRQMIASSWTVYVQDDAGKTLVLQTSPKGVEKIEYSDERSYQQENKADWMECIVQGSGIPKWLFAFLPFGFSFALLWLCCAMIFTTPSEYASSTKKKDMGYILVCEPDKELKAPLIAIDDDEAPPLPPKAALI